MIILGRYPSIILSNISMNIIRILFVCKIPLLVRALPHIKP